MTAEPLLRTTDITRRFDGVLALDGVSIDVPVGGVYGLIGPNGSGKTTLFNVITGVTRPDRGEILFEGKRITGKQPYDIARLGIARTFQHSLAPGQMTVMENMLLAAKGQLGESIVSLVLRSGAVRAQERANIVRARDILAIVNLSAKENELAGNLSGGQKKLLSLAQALMAEPDLIMLDEPVAGVNPVLVEEIAAVIRKLCEGGRNFLIVEHNMLFIRRTCDRVSVLDSGRVIAQGTPEEALGNEAVLKAYLARRPAAEPKPLGGTA